MQTECNPEQLEFHALGRREVQRDLLVPDLGVLEEAVFVNGVAVSAKFDGGHCGLSLNEVDVTAGTFLCALLAAVAELHLEFIGLARNKRLDHRLILAIAPASSAVKTRSAAHTTHCLTYYLLFG